MFSAADLIHALQRKLQLIAPHLRRAPGTFPPGWQAWFDSMAQRAGEVRGATADAVIAVFLQRPLAMRPARAAELTRWQAFGTLWRQEWHGAGPRDKYDRRMHWFATAFTVLWHVFFGAMLLYLMYLRFMELSAAQPQGEQDVVMVEYVGRGTPAEPGGGTTQPSEQPAATAAPSPRPAPPATTAAPPESSAPAPSAVPAPPAPSIEAPLPDIAQRDVPEPQVPQPAPPVEQAVTVSEPTPSEPSVFVLPPTRRQPPQPTLAAPQIDVPVPTVRATDVAEPVQPIRRDLPPREIAAPTIEQQPREITMRDVPAPLPRVPVRELPAPAVPVPQVRTPEASVRAREVPTPSPPATTPAPAAPASVATTAPAASAPATTASTAPPSTAPATTAPAASGAPASGPPASAPSTAPGTQPATAGAGPRPTPAPGTWSTPRRGDDWGESTRNVPGGQRGVEPGLYNADGSVRIAEAPGSAAPGQPPGTLTEEIRDLDRSGTWLKRKPTDFEPTSFDKYWVPNETLLAEWVRKGIKKVAIPIPGTNKRIECVVSLLSLGGGCGLSDPNLNDQPAGARPPPDIPFKPELQENNGSTRP